MPSGLKQSLPPDARVSCGPVEPVPDRRGILGASAQASIIKAVHARLSRQDLPVLEGTYDCGNISAVARSADALGLGAMHIVATEGMRP